VPNSPSAIHAWQEMQKTTYSISINENLMQTQQSTK